MKRNWLLLLILLLPLLTLAQARKSVKKRSKYVLEQFEVLANNDTVRDGSYRKLFGDDKKLVEEGQYADNRRVGLWTFYDHNAQPELLYNYTNKQVVSVNRTQRVASVAQFYQGDSVVSVRLDDGPIYLASSYQIYGIMGQTARLPANLQRAGVNHLTFRVLATVSAAGGHYRILPSMQDAEFIRASQAAADAAFAGVEWIPAVYQQKPVTATYLFEEITLTGYSSVTGVVR